MCQVLGTLRRSLCRVLAAKIGSMALPCAQAQGVDAPHGMGLCQRALILIAACLGRSRAPCPTPLTLACSVWLGALSAACLISARGRAARVPHM